MGHLESQIGVVRMKLSFRQMKTSFIRAFHNNLMFKVFAGSNPSVAGFGQYRPLEDLLSFPKYTLSLESEPGQNEFT